MSTFSSSFIRRWERDRVATFARAAGFVAKGPYIGKREVLRWVDQKANTSESWNQKLWDSYHAMKKTSAKPTPQPRPQTDEAQIAQIVQRELHRDLSTVVNAAVASQLPDTARIFELLEQVQAQKDSVTETVLKHVEKLAMEQLSKHQRIEIKQYRKQRAKKMDWKLPPVFKDIIQLASQRIHVMMVGPTGSGKTFLAERVAEAFDLDFASISCSAGMSESKLEGSLLPTGRNGKFEYWPSTFVEMYENGGVFLFDEIDAADPNTLTFINAALAGDHFFIDKRIGEQECVRHPDFICLAAANTWGQGADAEYVGREQLDAATLNRFAVGMVEVNYDRDVERFIVQAIIEDETSLNEFLNFCWSARDAVQNHRIRRAVSTRFMKELAVMVSAYDWKRDKWEVQLFRGWSGTESGKVRDTLRYV